MRKTINNTYFNFDEIEVTRTAISLVLKHCVQRNVPARRRLVSAKDKLMKMGYGKTEEIFIKQGGKE